MCEWLDEDIPKTEPLLADLRGWHGAAVFLTGRLFLQDKQVQHGLVYLALKQSKGTL